MSDLLRKLFHANKTHQVESDSIKVLISLAAAADDTCLNKLKGLGLEVTQSTGNKLMGKIAPGLLPKLESQSEVLEVERSVTLNPLSDESEAVPRDDH